MATSAYTVTQSEIPPLPRTLPANRPPERANSNSNSGCDSGAHGLRLSHFARSRTLSHLSSPPACCPRSHAAPTESHREPEALKLERTELMGPKATPSPIRCQARRRTGRAGGRRSVSSRASGRPSGPPDRHRPHAQWMRQPAARAATVAFCSQSHVVASVVTASVLPEIACCANRIAPRAVARHGRLAADRARRGHGCRHRPA